MTRADIERCLREYGLSPNRALGQNFLCDETAANAIASFASDSGLPVLEIGPGLGALTEALIPRSSRVTAVELDSRMVKILSARFASSVDLVEGDFLGFDIDLYAGRCGGGYAVAANLPYYITTDIFMKLVSSRELPKRMALMMQKEAAERLFASPGSRAYGPAAVLAGVYFERETLLRLSPASFFPEPEVDSVVSVFTLADGAHSSPALRKTVSMAFSARRKTLFNNLRAAGVHPDAARAALSPFPPSVRAEQLAPGEFVSLAERLADDGSLF